MRCTLTESRRDEIRWEPRGQILPAYREACTQEVQAHVRQRFEGAWWFTHFSYNRHGILCVQDRVRWFRVVPREALQNMPVVWY